MQKKRIHYSSKQQIHINSRSLSTTYNTYKFDLFENIPVDRRWILFRDIFLWKKKTQLVRFWTQMTGFNGINRKLQTSKN